MRSVRRPSSPRRSLGLEVRRQYMAADLDALAAVLFRLLMRAPRSGHVPATNDGAPAALAEPKLATRDEGVDRGHKHAEGRSVPAQ